MNEQYDAARQYTQDCLNDFLAGLYLTGEPLGENSYDVARIAHAGGQYLHAVGINTLASQPPGEILLAQLQASAVSGTDHTQTVLGTVVGVALFHPDSSLNLDRKQLLLSRSLSAVRRLAIVEPGGSRRASSSIFAEELASFARLYEPRKDRTQFRSDLYDQLILDESQFTKETLINRALGERTLNRLNKQNHILPKFFAS